MAEPQHSAVAELPLGRRGLRLLVELARLAPRPLAVAVAGAALFSGCTVLATVVLGRVTDRLIVPTFATGEVPPGALGRAVLGVAAVGLLRAAGTIVRRYYAAVVTEEVHVAFRHGLADRYLGLPLAWHQANPTGQLLAHTESDTEMTADVLGPLPYSFGVLFLALFSVVALVAADPVLAAVALLIFPALTLLNRVYSRRVEGPAAEVQARIGRVSAIAHESFDGALVVKTLGREAAEVERFTAAARELQASRLRVGYLRAVFESFLDLLPNLGIVAVVLVGALRIRAGAMTPGDLVQVAALFAVLAVPMRIFGYLLESLPPSLAARGRLATVLDEPLPETPPPAEERPGATPAGPAPAAPDLVAEGVSFAYGPGAPVLTGVDLRIEPGEVVAVVGSTGAGKSTLCLLLAGLVPPTTGRIQVGGRPLDQLGPVARTDTVALVFQESFLFADTVEANVDLSGGASQEEIWRALRLARAETLVEELPAGLHTVLGERGVTLSGGQRQRIALARALIRRPRLLLLDDATSAVDPVVEQEILARLGAATRHRAAGPGAGATAGRAMTTVIVAQRRSTIELADRVLYLSDGRIAAAGPHEHLLATQPGYEALVRAYEEQLR